MTAVSKRSEAWLKLIHIVSNVEADLGRILQARHGIGLSEYRALEILSRSQDSELRMQELSTHLRLNQSSVSRMVERLERADLAIRDLCPDDKRGVYTVLTKKGRAHLKKAQIDYEKALEAVLAEHGGESLLDAK